MTAITHEIKIEAPVEEVFKAINTLKGLRAWHTQNIEGSTEVKGILTFISEGEPTFKWKIIKSELNKRIVWECLEGPGDSVGTQAIYSISKLDDGRSFVEFTHTQWPHDQGNFRKCNTLWAVLLHHLKSYVETNKVEANF